MHEVHGEVLRPNPVDTVARLPYGGVIAKTGSKPFTVYHQHGWSFVVPPDLDGLPLDLVESAQPFSVEPERSRVTGKFIGRRSWAVPAIDGKGEWLPQLEAIAHEPGANGVRLTHPDPRIAKIDATGLLVGMEQKKATRIPLYDNRLGPLTDAAGVETYADYAQRYLLTSGYYLHVFTGVRFELLNRGKRAEPATDFGWLYGFRRRVVSAGIVEPMARQSLGGHIRLIDHRLREYQTRQRAGKLSADAYKQMRDEGERLIEHMTAAWERQFAALVGEAPTVRAMEAAVEEEEGRHFDGEMTVSLDEVEGTADAPIDPEPPKGRKGRG